MRQIFGDVRWEVKAAVFFSLVVIFTVVGPFGSYESMHLAERFTYWTAVMTGIGFFMHVFMTMALRAPSLGHLPGVAKITIGAAIAAIPGAAIVEFANEVFRPTGVHLSVLLRTWLQVTLVGLIVGIVEYLDWRPQATQIRDIITPMHKRLSPEIGTDIISMSMQDHYVEVTTTQGKQLILMRFADALEEVHDLPGQRVHRSHWVALAHLGTLSKKGNKSSVTLSDQRELPVSGTYLSTLQAHLSQPQK